MAKRPRASSEPNPSAGFQPPPLRHVLSVSQLRHAMVTTQLARWKSFEFILYFAVLVAAFALGWVFAAERLPVVCIEDPFCAAEVKHGYFFTRPMDVSDEQLHMINRQLIAGATLVYTLFAAWGRKKSMEMIKRAILSVVFVCALHGVLGASIFIGLCLLNYGLLALAGKRTFLVLKRRVYVATVATWAFALAAVLVFQDPITWGVDASRKGSHDFWRAILLPSRLPLWKTMCFPMFILKILSFNLDYIKCMNHSHQQDRELLAWKKMHVTNCDNCLALRGAIPLQQQQTGGCYTWYEHALLTDRSAFSVWSMTAFVLYPGTFMCGPVTPFAAFWRYSVDPLKSVNWKAVVWLGVRLAISHGLLELFSRLFYVFALSKTMAYGGMSALEGVLFLFILAMLLWLKFLVFTLWGRAWTLLDRKDCPAAFQRCLFNHLTVTGFLRGFFHGWHRWLVMYVYVPLGGRENRCRNVLVCLLLVALLRGLSADTVLWALLVWVAFVVESALRSVLKYRIQEDDSAPWYWRHLRAVGAVLCGLFVGAVFLCGHVVSFRALREIFFAWKAAGLAGLGLLGILGLVMFAGAQVSIEIREEEKRRFILKRC